LHPKTFTRRETISSDERLMNAMFRAVSERGCLKGIKFGTATEETSGWPVTLGTEVPRDW
jgi:hypothetical protein